MAGQADGLEGEPDALGDEQVDQAERDGQALAAGQHLVEEAVARIGVVLDVAAEAVLVEQHAVEHAALLAGGGGLDDQFAAARRRSRRARRSRRRRRAGARRCG